MKKLAILLFVSTISIAGFSQTEMKRPTTDNAKVKGEETPNMAKAKIVNAGSPEEQKKIINDLEVKHKIAAQDVKNDASLTAEQKDEKLKALATEFEKEMAKFNTPAPLNAVKEINKN